jgi:hypothetical protein
MALVLHLLNVERAITATLLFEHVNFGFDPGEQVSYGYQRKQERLGVAKRLVREAWNVESVAYTRQALVSAGTAQMGALLNRYEYAKF